jgi:hypothetical protein
MIARPGRISGRSGSSAIISSLVPCPGRVTPARSAIIGLCPPAATSTVLARTRWSPTQTPAIRLSLRSNAVTRVR